MLTLPHFLGSNIALMLIPKEVREASVKAPPRSPVISSRVPAMIGPMKAPIHTLVSMKPIAVTIPLGLIPESWNGIESVIGQKVQAATLAMDMRTNGK